MTRSSQKKTLPKKTGRSVSKEEKELWDQVVGKIDSLNPIDGLEDTTADGSSRKEPQSRVQPYIKTSSVSFQPEMLHGIAPGLDRATQQKMRRGKVNLEARIDLHGMSQNEAYKALTNFLANCRDDGFRSVLVITGKGVAGGGILRAAVPKWLNESANRQMVRAFSHASPKDGGEGALYVMLRRLR